MPELAKRSQQWSDASKGFTEGLAKPFIDVSLNVKLERCLTKENITKWSQDCVDDHGATREQGLMVKASLEDFWEFLVSACDCECTLVYTADILPRRSRRL